MAEDTPRLLFIPVPAGGFTREQLSVYLNQGRTAVGIFPVVENEGEEPVQTMVLDRVFAQLPIPMLARLILEAHTQRTGLNGLVKAIFGMTLGQLATSARQAEAENQNGPS